MRWVWSERVDAVPVADPSGGEGQPFAGRVVIRHRHADRRAPELERVGTVRWDERAAFIEVGQVPNAGGTGAVEQPLALSAMPKSTAALALATPRP